MAGIRNRISEILLKARVLDELQLRSALSRHEQWGGRLTRVISDMGLADEETLTEAICHGMNLPRTRLGHIPKDATALAKIDVTYAEQRGVFPVSLKDNGKTLVLAMADPTDLQCIDQVAAKARARVFVMVAGDREIQTAIQRYYRGIEPAPQRPQMARTHDVDPSVGTADDYDEDEGKIVDMSGKTLFKNIKDIMGAEAPPPINKAPTSPGFAAPPLPSKPPTSPGMAAPQPSSSGRATADMLDEILGSKPIEAFTPEELQRIEALRENQEKSSRILRAVLELCIEKGYVKQAELAARMK